MSRESTRWRRLLRLAFVLALALTLFFTVRITLAALYWRNPDNADQVIQGWMPVRYIARSWDIPPEVMAEALGFDPSRSSRRSLAQIAADHDVPVETLIAQIMAAIETHRGAGHD